MTVLKRTMHSPLFITTTSSTPMPCCRELNECADMRTSMFPSSLHMGYITTDLEEENDVPDLRLEGQTTQADHWKGPQNFFQHLLAIAAACFSVSTGTRYARRIPCPGNEGRGGVTAAYRGGKHPAA